MIKDTKRVRFSCEIGVLVFSEYNITNYKKDKIRI